MPTDLLHTQGTKFYRGTGAAPYAYTQVARLIDAAPPGKKRKALDATTLDQSSSYMAKVGSLLIEQEPVELEFLMTKDGLDTLETDMESADSVPYKLELTDGTTYEFLGLVTAMKPSGKMDDLFKAKVTIEIDGEADKTAAA